MIAVKYMVNNRMNAWSVSLRETSVGAFMATATRDTGSKVERSGDEEVKEQCEIA